MAHLTPPPLPPFDVGTVDENPLNRVHFRLWQISLAASVVLISGWFWTLGTTPGIIVSFLAKHVLVAIYIAGAHLPEAAARK